MSRQSLRSAHFGNFNDLKYNSSLVNLNRKYYSGQQITKNTDNDNITITNKNVPINNDTNKSIIITILDTNDTVNVGNYCTHISTLKRNIVQNDNSVCITNGELVPPTPPAGNNNSYIGNASISVGSVCGINTAGNSSNINIGVSCGLFNQGCNCINYGFICGAHNQKNNSISVGEFCGYCNQAEDCIAIGNEAGYNEMKSNSIAIGLEAAKYNQKPYSIAIGKYAGRCNQDVGSIAIGTNCGRKLARPQSIAIGNRSGYNTLTENSIAIGWDNSPFNLQQNSNTITIGSYYTTAQGRDSICIGISDFSGTRGVVYALKNNIHIGNDINSGAGYSPENSVVLKTRQGEFVPFNGSLNLGFFIDCNIPSRNIGFNASSNDVLFYDPSTYEIYTSTN